MSLEDKGLNPTSSNGSGMRQSAMTELSKLTTRYSLIRPGNSLVSSRKFPVPMRREFHRNYLIYGVKSRA